MKRLLLPKDKYPSVFYMVDGRLETILDVANKISKKYDHFISSEDPAYIYIYIIIYTDDNNC